MAAYKLQVLSSFLFRTQLQDSDLNSLTCPNHNQAMWLESFPNETAFPDDLFFIPKLDFSEASAKLQALHAEAHLADNVPSQIVRITLAAFCESVGQGDKLL